MGMQTVGASLPRLVVYTGKYVKGLRAPGERDDDGNTTHDWRAKPGSADNRGSVRAVGQSLPVHDALDRMWPTHAMLVAYALRDPHGKRLEWQPRVNKSALPWLREQGYALEFPYVVVEGDTPGHVPWTADLWGAFAEARAQTPLLDGTIFYGTPRGWRSLWALAEPIVDPDAYENVAHGLLATLARTGLDVDTNTLDWTRLFAVPRHRRPDGTVVGESWRAQFEVSNARLWRIDELPSVARGRGSSSGRAASQATVRVVPPEGAGDAWEPGAIPFLDATPPLWRARCAQLAEAMLAVTTAWHPLYLALAGALCERGVTVELVPAIVGGIADATGCDNRRGDRVRGAVTTVYRYEARRAGAEAPIRGYDALLLEWPTVAAVFDAVIPDKGPDRMERLCNRPMPILPPAEEVQVAIADAIRSARAGATIVVTGCGTGKTTAAERAAADAAALPDTPSGRAPAGAKTAIATLTNEKAAEVYANLVALGVPARRIYSPLAHREGEEFACVYHKAGLALAGGGQSVRREFCDGRGVAPCERRAVCPAYAGAEGEERARVLVGTHALLGELATHAGPTGRLVIDESPPPVIVERMTLGDLSRVAEFAFAFFPSYVQACAALLAALRAAVEQEEVWPSEPVGALAARMSKSVPDVLVQRACEAAELPYVGADPMGEALRAAARAGGEGGRDVPPLTPTAVLRARTRGQEAFAAAIGTASKVLAAVHAAARAEMDGGAAHTARVERVKGGGAVLVITSPNQPLVDALRRDGVTVVLDATPDVAALSRLAGADLRAQGRVVEHHAAPRAQVERTLLYWPDGVRARLFRRDGLDPVPLRSALRAVATWAGEHPELHRLGLVTFVRAELVIGAALCSTGGPRATAARRLWLEKYGLDAANFDECVAAATEALAPWLRGGAGRGVQLAHYGGVRGLNRMQTVDAIATLGDPWPEMGESRDVAKYLGIDGWEERYSQQARDEITQAQGRLRVIWRDEKLLALHAGRTLPSDPLWCGSVQFRRLPAHRPTADAAMTAEALREALTSLGLSVRAAASRLGIGKSAVAQYLRAERPVPERVAQSVSALLRGGREGSVHASPNEYSLFIGGNVDTEAPASVEPQRKSWTPSEADAWWYDLTEPLRPLVD